MLCVSQRALEGTNMQLILALRCASEALTEAKSSDWYSGGNAASNEVTITTNPIDSV